MIYHACHISLAALLSVACRLASAAEPPPIAIDTVIVTGTRTESRAFDMPAAIDVVTRERIIDGQARINASESLVAVPGLVVQNRQNYAQDLQISSRGFGARSAFGVRGIKLIADGIPASTPDGQGQAATFNLDVVERIEVLRGPFSAIYGNDSGGVIQLFSRDGAGAVSVEGGVDAGSYATWKTSVTAQGKPDALGFLLNASRFDTNGYREHSAATRDQSFVKLNPDLGEGGKLALVANSLTQHDTQDPMGLSWSVAQANPRGVDPSALAFNTRKSIDHLQGGASYEQRFGEDRLQLAAYYGEREVEQFQSIPKAVQANPRHSGGVIAFERGFAGLAARWIAVRELAGGKLSLTGGLDVDRSSDDRRGYENFIGDTLGVQGRLRRDETDSVTGLGPYMQAEWQSEHWGVFVGLRYNEIRFEVDDRYIAPGNGDDSGSVSYRRTTPVAGVLYKIAPGLNIYASAAKGFETPTLTELSYSGSGGGFNFGLLPETSTHFELGLKSFFGDDVRLNMALFEARTENELVVDQAVGGRTSYKNASRTLRQGVEIAFDAVLAPSLTTRIAFTELRAIYDESFRSGSANTLVEAGDRLPGVARANAFAELAWQATDGIAIAFEGIYRGKVYVEDSNTEPPAPAYTQANLRLTAKQQFGAWRLSEFLRVDNLFDRAIIGSVIVGDTNRRYYEPAPGRNGMLGASAEYSF